MILSITAQQFSSFLNSKPLDAPNPKPNGTYLGNLAANIHANALSELTKKHPHAPLAVKRMAKHLAMQRLIMALRLRMNANDKGGFQLVGIWSNQWDRPFSHRPFKGIAFG